MEVVLALGADPVTNTQIIPHGSASQIECHLSGRERKGTQLFENGGQSEYLSISGRFLRRPV
jgi:hypothetical protein